MSPQSFEDAIKCDIPRPLLSWSHYCGLMQVADSKARDWHEKEAIEQKWSVRKDSKHESTVILIDDNCLGFYYTEKKVIAVLNRLFIGGDRMLDNKGFDLWAEGYDKAVGLSEEENSYPFAGYKNVLSGIFQEIMTKPNAKVLDIGFGTGTLTTKLYENGCDVYGQDFSQRMIELANEKMPNAKLFQGDFSKGLVPELKDCKFDFIIGTYSLHHLTDEEKITFFNGLLNQLNEGGKLLIGDVAFSSRAELENCRTEAGDEWDDDEIYFVLDELEKAFPNAEFKQKSYCSGIISIHK